MDFQKELKKIALERQKIKEEIQSKQEMLLQFTWHENRSGNSPSVHVHQLERKKALRNAVVMDVRWGHTEWHPSEQWLLQAFDIDKREVRSFAMNDMSEIVVSKKNRK